MRFHVIHTTRYIYEAAVSHSLTEVRLTPRAFEDQQLGQYVLRVLPEAPFMHRRKDYYGNDVTSFEVLERHEHLEITAESTVDVQPHTNGSIPSIPWEEARESIAELADPSCIEASEFVYNSPYVPATPQIVEYARDTFAPGRPLLDAAQELMHRIHDDFKYAPQSTSIDVPLAEVMRKRRGVCQDFAHVMIAAMRSVRLPARYVSGYVRPGPKVQGAQASHAWAAIYFPERGWIGFDPTNDAMVAGSHVTLAWGRDYGDVTPAKGISLGGGNQSVEIEVYVRPVTE
jgi:transglutaminase-like putative cysteine protease